MATNAHEPTARAPATVDARTAPRIAAAVVAAIGDAEADGGFPDDCTPGSMNSAARSAAAGSTAVLLAGCLAAGWWLETQFGGIAAHARPAGGSLKEPALGTGPRAARDGATGISSRGPGMNIPSIVTAAAAATMTASASVAQSAVEWPMSAGGNGHWYGIRQQPLPWDIASERARNEGGHLVTLAGSAEWDFLWAALGPIHGSTSPVWIGGYQDVTASDYSEPSGGWRWVTGEPWSYTSWASGCPNDNTVDGNEDAICTGSTGGWNDLAKAAICASLIEWSADCNGDGVVDYGQIRAGTLPDTNGNGVPDGCECAGNPGLPACCIGDIVSDRRIDGADLGTLLAYWGPRTAAAFSIASDLDGSGHVDGADLAALLSNWGACPASSVPPWATLLETQPDPAVVTDPNLRAAIVATGLPWRVRDTGTGIEMLLVPPGAFQMGCSQGSNNHPCNGLELPVHAVTITQPYYLGRYEVTQGEWQQQAGTNPSYFRGFEDSPSRPVDSVTWMAAQSFGVATGLRLPTEAEWELACRAGTATAFYNGTNNDGTVPSLAWCPANAGNETHPVGQLAPNAFGFHDMLGNVYEWTSDWFDYYTADAAIDPTGPANGTYRVLRGGAWYLDMISVRSSFRIYGNLNEQYPFVGFRVARDP
jgi:formylglycine-generating enzyme required for sulfatase activity